MLRKNLSLVIILLLSLIGVLFFTVNCSEDVYTGGGGGDAVTTSTAIDEETTTTTTTDTYVSTTFEPTTSITTIIDETTTTTTTYVSTTTTNISTSTSSTSLDVSTTLDMTTTTSSTSTSIPIESTTTTTTDTYVSTSISTSSSTSTTTTTNGSLTTTTTIIDETTTSSTTYVSTTTSSTSTTTTTIDDISPTATVAYSTTDPTNGDVTATITASESVTITNNEGLTTRIFTANGSFTFEFIDSAGNNGSVTATVNNIDKTSPTATVAYSTTDPTNGSVTATITPSESVTITNNDGLTTRTFTANGSFTFEFTDAAGNTGSVTATVANIDKTAPADPSIAINPTTPTSGDVTVTITFSGDSAVKQYKIGSGGSYQSYTDPFTVSEDTTIYAKAQDSVGNWSGEVSYSITNIDRGNFNITIELVTPDNPVIDFGTFDNQLNKTLGETLTISGVLDGTTQWEWYLEGVALGNTTNNCVINSALYDPGVYNLTLFAYKNDIMYSASIIFTIIN